MDQCLEWKLLGTVTGNNTLQLPTIFKELEILVVPNQNPQFCIKNRIVSSEIPSTEAATRYFPQIIPQNALATAFVTSQFGINAPSGYQLNYCYIGTTNVLSNTTSIVRYR